CFTHDPFFELLVLQISRSICIARDSTTKILDHSLSLFFSSFFFFNGFLHTWTATDVLPPLTRTRTIGLKPGQSLRLGAYCRLKRQADRCSPKADRATHP
ncbi:unnamed protein product, partial [Brassica rapa]